MNKERKEAKVLNFYEDLVELYHLILEKIFQKEDLNDMLLKIIKVCEQHFSGIECSIFTFGKMDRKLNTEIPPGLHPWTLPIFSNSGKILGTFSVYYSKPEKPSAKEQKMIDAASKLIGLAIDYHSLILHHRKAQEDLERTIRQRTEEIDKQYRLIYQAKDIAADGMRAKTQFLSNISHEFRTPLNAIIGFTDLLQDGYYGYLNKKQREFIYHIQKSSRNLLELVNNVLEISKAESDDYIPKINRIKINNLINYAISFIRAKAQNHDINLIIEIPAELNEHEIISDISIIKSVLLNILQNALKFTPQGGTITVSVSKEEKKLIFKVADTGKGIDKEEQEKIFESFYQVGDYLHEKNLGAGLGLAVSRKLLEFIGGRIWAESEGQGKGSQFYFVVPIDN